MIKDIQLSGLQGGGTNTSPDTVEKLTKIWLYFLIILRFSPLKYKYGFQTYQGNKLT